MQKAVAPYQSCLDWAPESSFVPRTIEDYVPRYLPVYVKTSIFMTVPGQTGGRGIMFSACPFLRPFVHLSVHSSVT